MTNDMKRLLSIGAFGVTSLLIITGLQQLAEYFAERNQLFWAYAFAFLSLGINLVLIVSCVALLWTYFRRMK